jgi:hypothetical protein
MNQQYEQLAGSAFEHQNAGARFLHPMMMLRFSRNRTAFAKLNSADHSENSIHAARIPNYDDGDMTGTGVRVWSLEAECRLVLRDVKKSRRARTIASSPMQ